MKPCRNPRQRPTPSSDWKDEATVWEESRRAEGTVPCSYCGHPLYDHFQPVKLSCPTMVEDCEGRWWKL